MTTKVGASGNGESRYVRPPIAPWLATVLTLSGVYFVLPWVFFYTTFFGWLVMTAAMWYGWTLVREEWAIRKAVDKMTKETEVL